MLADQKKAESQQLGKDKPGRASKTYHRFNSHTCGQKLRNFDFSHFFKCSVSISHFLYMKTYLFQKLSIRMTSLLMPMKQTNTLCLTLQQQKQLCPGCLLNPGIKETDWSINIQKDNWGSACCSDTKHGEETRSSCFNCPIEESNYSISLWCLNWNYCAMLVNIHTHPC